MLSVLFPQASGISQNGGVDLVLIMYQFGISVVDPYHMMKLFPPEGLRSGRQSLHWHGLWKLPIVGSFGQDYFFL